MMQSTTYPYRLPRDPAALAQIAPQCRRGFRSDQAERWYLRMLQPGDWITWYSKDWTDETRHARRTHGGKVTAVAHDNHGEPLAVVEDLVLGMGDIELPELGSLWFLLPGDVVEVRDTKSAAWRAAVVTTRATNVWTPDYHVQGSSRSYAALRGNLRLPIAVGVPAAELA